MIKTCLIYSNYEKKQIKIKKVWYDPTVSDTNALPVAAVVSAKIQLVNYLHDEIYKLSKTGFFMFVVLYQGRYRI